MKDYQTEQRKALLTLFQSYPEKQMSMDDILKRLPEGCQISRSAIYRNLDRMAKEGLLEKLALSDSRNSQYRYAGREKDCRRVHLRCEKCGQVFHMEKETDEERLDSLLKQSGFQIDGSATVIFGVCKRCK